MGQGLLKIEASRSHSDTPLSLGFLRTSDRPVAQTPTRQHTTFTIDKHPFPPPAGFEPAIPASERPL